MVGGEHGSLTKEPPLATLDETIRAITPEMPYSVLLSYARANTHRDAPGLLRQRFLLLNSDDTIAYDHFLSLAAAHGLGTPFIRKIMYFLWAYRDDRIRRFICEVIADSAGRWQGTALLDKSNSRFFTNWLSEPTARKARSNFEYFIVEEAGLYDSATGHARLSLDDGWLDQAAIAAAQHEPDRLVRDELLLNPIAFLERRGWLGLLDWRASSRPATSPLLTAAALPLEDDEIGSGPGNLPSAPAGNDWNRTNPSSSGRASTVVNIDLVSRERANQSHFALEKALAALAVQHKRQPKWNQNIDIYFETPHGTVLAEIKSCTDSNFHSQVRKGVSQLFEYRFLYSSLLGTQVTMLLIAEAVPPRGKRWLIRYLESLGILLAWKEANTDRLVSAGSLPPALAGIVHQVQV